jgi:hypothetical protein
MPSLKFDGNITLEEIFVQHKTLVYDSVVQAIGSCYDDPLVEEVDILSISINGTDHTINLNRSKFIDALHNAIEFFQRREEYEKCQACLIMINEMKKESKAAR